MLTNFLFERSQRVLTELVNFDTSSPAVLASDRESAADLVAAGRVYRRTADALGEAATSELLEDLERVLLDVANGSAEPTQGEIDNWRERIDQQDLVFRLRVVGAELRRRQAPARQSRPYRRRRRRAQPGRGWWRGRFPCDPTR